MTGIVAFLSKTKRLSRGVQLQRRNQFRTVTVGAFPVSGSLNSEVLAAVMPRLERLQASMPPGFRLETGGEYEDQSKEFMDLRS